MNNNWFFGVLVIALTVAGLLTQKQNAQSATSSLHSHTPPTSQRTTTTDKTFDQLMDDAMGQMDQAMKSAMTQGHADHEFVTMMIPHHQGAIDMSKAMLMYGRDEQIKRLAQEIITNQQNEVQLMKLWLAKHPESSRGSRPMEMPK